MRAPALDPPAIRRGLRRYAGDLRASRAFLASEVGHPGWLDLGQFRWRDWTPGRAARAALGTVVPLAIGIATGHVEFGTFAALGAQPAGVVSFQGVTRSRVLLVLAAVAGMAVSTFVGATVATAAPWLLALVIGAWAWAAGVCAALGPAAIVVSLQWPVALLIASAIPLTPEQALVRAGLVLAGGLWQGALVVSSWAVSRGATERTAMADSYAALSDYAAWLGEHQGTPPPPEALPGTSALRDPNPLMRSDARRHLTDLMVEAERIRTTLAVVAGTGATGDGPPGAARRELLAVSSRALAEIAAALRARPAARAGHLDHARAVLGPDPEIAGHSWTWAGESLHGQLRSAIRIARRLSAAEPGRGSRPPGHQRVRPPTHDLLVTLRANVGTSSEAGRHALRLAVVTGLAEMIARAASLPHGYWAALTALLVLRPDYGSTLWRGVQRAGGTVIGAGAGLAIVLVGHLGPVALLTGIAVTLFASYALLTVNYLLFAVFLTAFVVVELDLLGLPADQTAPDRLVATALGAALALLAYILWPTWERASTTEKFARLYQAQCRFAAQLLRAYSRPGGADLAQARQAKIAARRARSGAESSADRLTDQPERPPVTHAFAMALVSAGHRMALAALAVEAATRVRHASLHEAGEDGPDPVQPRLDELAGLVRQAGAQLAEALRRPGPPGPLPPLREIQVTLIAAAACPPPGEPSGAVRSRATRGGSDILPGAGAGGGEPAAGDPATDAGALAIATDSLVDALGTTSDILRRYLSRPA